MATNELPYYRSEAKPHLAKERIQKTLEKFGVDQVSMSENFKTREIRLTFVHQGIPVSIPINYGALGELYNGGRRKFDLLTEVQQKRAKNACYSALEDYLKSMLTMHQLEIMDLTTLFLPNLVGKDGIRMADLVQNHLPQFLEGKLLTEGK